MDVVVSDILARTTLLGLLVISLVALLRIQFGADTWSPAIFFGVPLLVRFIGPVLDILTGNASRVITHGPVLTNSNLIFASLIMTAGTVAFTAGYINRVSQQVARETVVQFSSNKSPLSTWNTRRATIIAISFSVIGFASYAVFIQQTLPAINSLADISSKRHVNITAYIRWGIQGLMLATILNAYTYVRAASLSDWWKVWAAMVALAAMSYPIYVSNRGILAVFVLSLAVIYHYEYRPVSVTKIVGIGVIGLEASSLLLGLRQASRYPNVSLTSFIIPTRAISEIFGASFGGIVVLAKAINVSWRSNRLLAGQTLLQWLFAPIPGDFLNLKHIGEVLAASIYGQANGTPPTIIGELYLNYHLFGVVVGLFLIGGLARVSYDLLRAHQIPIMSTQYILVGPVFLVYIMLGSFSAGMIYMLMWTIPLLPSVYLITNNRTTKARGLAAPKPADDARSILGNSVAVGVIFRVSNAANCLSESLALAWTSSWTRQMGVDIVKDRLTACEYSRIRQEIVGSGKKFKEFYKLSRVKCVVEVLLQNNNKDNLK